MSGIQSYCFELPARPILRSRGAELVGTGVNKLTIHPGGDGAKLLFDESFQVDGEQVGARPRAVTVLSLGGEPATSHFRVAVAVHPLGQRPRSHSAKPPGGAPG